ncbi:MAG: Hint domain-containing protein [Candidatus Saccharibacteria bacterium]|nr:Hint domain-containing protein [Pseudorhodobacter sp.]
MAVIRQPSIGPDPVPSPGHTPGHACQIFQADDIFVVSGSNQGDGVRGPADVDPGDVYQLERGAVALRLVVSQPDGGRQHVEQGSEVGQTGQEIRLEARYALMAPDGDKVELLILRLGTDRFVLPLSPIGSQVDYTLLSVEPAPMGLMLADLLCLSFARGTMITMHNGKQRAIENLKAGDKLLTRDHGKQPVRWIGHARLRAVGAFAPVVIPAGTLGNAGDLILSQHHRVFLYQRQRLAGLTTSELLVQARHFVDDERVYLREGGYVDYFSLVFDQHEIIYAEGIPLESLMVNDATVNRLPPEIAAEVKAQFPGLSQIPHFGTEAGRQFLDAISPAVLFKKR